MNVHESSDCYNFDSNIKFNYFVEFCNHVLYDYKHTVEVGLCAYIRHTYICFHHFQIMAWTMGYSNLHTLCIRGKLSER